MSSCRAQYKQQYKADGSLSGNAGSGGQFALTGKWNVAADGKICVDIAGSEDFKIANCNIVWKVGDKYFGSANDAPETVVRERQYGK